MRGGVPGADAPPVVDRATSNVYPPEANKVVNLAKQAIGRDAGVKDALGALQRVENIIGSGSPAPGAVAVSFSASFRRQGNPFKLAFGKEAGTTKVANRGSNVSQIKARADGGKLVVLFHTDRTAGGVNFQELGCSCL